MPRNSRCKCIECDKTFDANQVRSVGDGLLRLFLAVGLSKRIDGNDCICHKCRSYFVHWKEKMNGDFDRFENCNGTDGIIVNNDSNQVKIHLFC